MVSPDPALGVGTRYSRAPTSVSGRHHRVDELDPPYAAPMAATDATDRTAAQPRHIGYIRQIHLELVLLLVVISAAAAVFGLSLRPQSNGFPKVPEGLSLSVSGNQVHALSETLVRTSENGSKLELLGSDILQSPLPTERWKLSVGNLGTGRVCTPGEYSVDNGGASEGVPIPTQHPTHPVFVSTGGPPVSYTDVQNRGFFYVVLCWSSAGPVSLSGSYLSAEFPSVFDDSQTVSLTRTLVANSGDTANFAIESQKAPTIAFSASWQWPLLRTVDASRLRFSAIDVSGTQHDTYRAFVSGIILGIGGGAVITLLQELVLPLSRRRDARNAA